MARCPVCYGERQLDMRDLDAELAELLDDDALEIARSGEHWMQIVPCDECDATGVVSEARAADLVAVQRALLDQAFAALEARGELAPLTVLAG